MMMRNTVFCSVPVEVIEDQALQDKVTESIHDMVATVETYVPGYQLRAEPQYEAPKDIWNGMARVAVFLQVTGRGDYLPEYAGNLDIITSAAARVGELIAERRIIDDGKEAK